MNRTGYKPLLQTREELVQSGYIINEPIEKAGFKDGILIEFSDASFDKNTLTVKANKYRGPLGAVGAEFTVRFKDGAWAVDEPEMVWMS